MYYFYPQSSAFYQLPRRSLTASEEGLKQFSLSSGPSTAKAKSNSFSTSRDSEWLMLEICREYLREVCPRGEESCCFAHPSKNICCSNGRVVCCYDYIKGRCHRYQPPCKYLHPPKHLQEQLLEKGKANLLSRGKTSSVHQGPSNLYTPKLQSEANWSSIQMFPQEFVQHPVNGKQVTNNMPSVLSLPYFFISTSDNHIIDDEYSKDSVCNTVNLNLPIKCFEAMKISPLSNSQIPIQQYILNNNYCHNGQIYIKEWPLCSYQTLPY